MTPTEFLKHIKTLLSSLTELADVPVIIDDGQLSLEEDIRNEALNSGLNLSVLIAETSTRAVNCRGRQVILNFGVSVYQPCLQVPGAEAAGARIRDIIYRSLHLSSVSDKDCNDRICFKTGSVIEHSQQGSVCGTIYAMAFETKITYTAYQPT